MTTLYDALGSAVTGKFFVFDGLLRGWRGMAEVIQRRGGTIRDEWAPYERAQGDTHYHIARPSTKGRPNWKHLTPRQLIAHLVNNGAQAAMYEAFHMTPTQPLPRPGDEMRSIIMIHTPLTLEAHRACIMFSPVERFIRNEKRLDGKTMSPVQFLSMLLWNEVEGCDQKMDSDDEAINDHILSLKRPDGTTMSTVQFRSKLQLDQDDEEELAINGPVPSWSSQSPTPLSRNVRSPTPMDIDPPVAPAAPAAPAEETEADRGFAKDMSRLHLGKRRRVTLSPSSYPASKHVRRNDGW